MHRLLLLSLARHVERLDLCREIPCLASHHLLLLKKLLVQTHELVYLRLDLTLIATASGHLWHLHHRIGALIRLMLIKLLCLVVWTGTLVRESSGSC